jgi:3-hydroxyisobutyrate dehydrogenase
MSTIGFIGLGHMGHPMALNLIKAGHTVYAYDVLQDAVKAIEKEGAHGVDSVSALAKNSEIIITSVQTEQQVTAICLTHEGLFSYPRPGLLYIDCSSIDVATTKYLHAEAAKLQIAMLDAPVSGGVSGAKNGTLTFMVGGSKTNFLRGLPILEAMGKKIVHAGPAGSGQAAKICNNLILGISMIGVCEGFSLAEKLGLDLMKFFEISSNASGQCWSMTTYCPAPGILPDAPSTHNYRPGFMAKMMLKDLRLAQHAAQMVHAAIPMGAGATELYELFVDHGFGDVDFSGIINFIANKGEKKERNK